MNRKLVKQGLNALTITLPSTWIKKTGLKQGDEVELTETDSSIIISTSKTNNVKDIVVDISGLIPRLADRFMARAYQKGYDKITIKFDDPNLMLAVKEKVSELMGFEILNASKNKIDVQVISNQLNLDFKVLLRRTFLLLMDMCKTCETGWKEKDKTALNNIFYQDIDVNKFTYFCLRELNKSYKIITFGSSILYYLIESLEDLGDELKVLGKILSTQEMDKEVYNLLIKLNELFRLSYEFFYTPEKSKAVKAFKLTKEIKKDINDALGKKNKEMTQALISIDFSMRIIYHLTTMRLDTLKDLREKNKKIPEELM